MVAVYTFIFYPVIMPADPRNVLILVLHNLYMYSYIFSLDRIFSTQKGTLIDFRFFLQIQTSELKCNRFWDDLSINSL